jgi:pimeloyl-ACP methyl ester carboxylesterase
MPVRVIWAENDGWLSTEVGERLCDLIPDATMSVIPDAGHLIQLDAPAALMSEIRAWLDHRQPATGPE